MSNTVIAMAVFLLLVVACCFYLDLRFVLPFIQGVGASYSTTKEDTEDEMRINNIGLYIIQVTMIFAFIVMGYQIPTRLVLACAGLGVGEKVFMLGFQVVVEYRGYKKAKALKEAGEEAKTEEPEVKEEAETAKEESTEAEATKEESTEVKESEGTESESEAKEEEPEGTESEPKAEDSRGTESETQTEEEAQPEDSKTEDTDSEPETEEPESEGTPEESPISDKETEDVHTNEAELKK